MHMKNIHYMKRAWSMAHYQKQSEPTTIQALFIGLKKNQFSWNENQPRQDSSLLGVFLETVVALLITNVADDNLKELLLSKIHWPDGISMKWCSSSNRLHLPHGSILHRAAGSHVLHHVYKKIENAPCYHYYQFIIIPKGHVSQVCSYPTYYYMIRVTKLKSA